MEEESNKPVSEGWKSRVCPVCGGEVIPIVYGYLTDEMAQAFKKGEILVGGCVIDVLNDPDCQCKKCGTSFKECNDELYKLEVVLNVKK